VINPSQRPLPDNTQHSQQTDIHAPVGIRAHNLSRRAAEDPRLRLRGQWDWQFLPFILLKCITKETADGINTDSKKVNILFITFKVFKVRLKYYNDVYWTVLSVIRIMWYNTRQCNIKSNKGHPCHVIGGTEVTQSYSSTHFQPRRWVGLVGQSHTPAALPPGKKPGTQCTLGSVGTRSLLDGCGAQKVLCTKRCSNPESSDL
jgi:hypothetical protein